MRRSMHLLCAAAVGLAACGSKDEVTNLANSATNSAASAANTAANTATNAADTVANTANTAVEAGKGHGTSPATGKPKIKLNVQKVAFAGCTRLVKVSKPNGCLVVKSGSQTYDIDSTRPLPYPNSPIEGTGIYLPNQQGTCMVGKPLSGVKWTYTGKHCGKGKG